MTSSSIGRIKSRSDWLANLIKRSPIGRRPNRPTASPPIVAPITIEPSKPNISLVRLLTFAIIFVPPLLAIVFQPTFPRDARELPWPIADRRYRLFVSLRVWHHLAPAQRACFEEARRVARNVLIACPEEEVVGVGIPRSEWISWNGGNPVVEKTTNGWGNLYLFEGSR